MGPFPHDSAPAEITEQNPAGTDGMEFVEFAHPNPEELDILFRSMGFVPVAKHKSRNVTLYRQGDINYLLNADPSRFAARFVKEHGPCAPSMAWRVADAEYAFKHAVKKGARPYEGDDKVLDVPAVYGIGDSLLYFVDTYGSKGSVYENDFNWLDEKNPAPEGFGFYYLDHLTHNVIRGNMDKWYNFYADLFNFKQIRFFNIDGKYTGLLSRALTSPCGKIRIPLNESKDAVSQIEEYLNEYNGEGIQHVAVGASNIYSSLEIMKTKGLDFMPAPPQAYYNRIDKRVPGHGEDVAQIQKYGVLIDGEGVVDGGHTKVLLQIFSKTVIGPIFFEFIQRKGDDGFGEGNFKALFESIEDDQVQRGAITVDAAE